jgi:hypothetical protein
MFFLVFTYLQKKKVIFSFSLHSSLSTYAHIKFEFDGHSQMRMLRVLDFFFLLLFFFLFFLRAYVVNLYNFKFESKVPSYRS